MVDSTKVLFWSSVVLQLVWWLICFELATRNLVILWHSPYAYDLVKLDFVSMPAETRKQSKVNYKSLHLTGCAVSSIENELVERESKQPGFEQFLGIFSPVRKKISSMTENAQNKEGAVAGDIQMKTEVGVGETVQINEEISDSEELELAIAKIQQQKERVKKKIKRKELMARLEQEKSELAELQEKDERTKVGEKSKGKTKTKSEVSKKGEVKKAVSGSSKAVKQKESVPYWGTFELSSLGISTTVYYGLWTKCTDVSTENTVCIDWTSGTSSAALKATQIFGITGLLTAMTGTLMFVLMALRSLMSKGYVTANIIVFFVSAGLNFCAIIAFIVTILNTPDSDSPSWALILFVINTVACALTGGYILLFCKKKGILYQKRRKYNDNTKPPVSTNLPPPKKIKAKKIEESSKLDEEEFQKSKELIDEKII